MVASDSVDHAQVDSLELKLQQFRRKVEEEAEAEFGTRLRVVNSDPFACFCESLLPAKARLFVRRSVHED